MAVVITDLHYEEMYRETFKGQHWVQHQLQWLANKFAISDTIMPRLKFS